MSGVALMLTATAQVIAKMLLVRVNPGSFVKLTADLAASGGRKTEEMQEGLHERRVVFECGHE